MESSQQDTAESSEVSENEDIEPKSVVYIEEQIHQYDNLLKENEMYKQRFFEFQSLQENIINWLNVNNENILTHIKNEFDKETHFQTVNSLEDLELANFSVNVRPYHNDAILKINNNENES